MSDSQWLMLQVTRNQFQQKTKVKTSGIKPKGSKVVFQCDNARQQVVRLFKL